MAGADEFFEVTSDYAGREGDASFLHVLKGDIVRVFKKELVHYIVEKDGQTGKVPKGKLSACQRTPNVNQSQVISTSQIATSQPKVVQRLQDIQTASCAIGSEITSVNQYEVLADYTNPDQTTYLNVKKGDHVTLVQSDANGWSQCRKDGRQANPPEQPRSSIQLIQQVGQSSLMQPNLTTSKHKWSDYVYDDELSSGAFGRIILMHLQTKSKDEQNIIKKLPYTKEDKKKIADEEIKVLNMVKSPYTVRLIETFIHELDICLVMEYCPGGNLRQMIDKDLKKMSDKDRKLVQGIFIRLLDLNGYGCSSYTRNNTSRSEARKHLD
ncbi:MAG: hypothetical protein EZS28_015400 [Streblomastix strix]|uniref:non-specific serine/threonine protein kinase n=1 Tax=Streblomastix strix TaxID=222440 RepID=A0A5J4W2G1_9EUKA|nr:MAG: hypothetical protein EZS28_015400 [Streblomastix strix]